MNLPGFRKGEVLRAADLQALSDAVAAVCTAGRYVPGGRGAPPEKFPLRTPLRDSGDGRIVHGYDNPQFVGMGDDAQGYLMATAYGAIAGPSTKFCELPGVDQQIIQKAAPGFKGMVWQTICVDNVGRFKNKTGPYVDEPKEGKWWWEECGGQLTYLLGCVRCNPCSNAGAPNYMRYYFRRHQQLTIPHIAVNACLCEGTVPLVMPHKKTENVSRVRRLKAGEGVRIECCENFLRVTAEGGGLRPINPPGCWCGCCGEEETPAGGCSPAGGCCEKAKPVQLVGCEYPAGAPTGVIIRQLVGRAGAKVRLSCCMCSTVEVLSKVPVNAGDCPGCMPGVLRLVLPTCCWTCCTVPLRRVEPGGGLRGDVTPRSARVWVDLSVSNCTPGVQGDYAKPCSGGWVQTFFQPAPLPTNPCDMNCYDACRNGARRQLMRYNAPDPYSGGLQIVNQVKKDGVWVREE